MSVTPAPRPLPTSVYSTFPHPSIYPVQETYIHKLHMALSSSANALLESPTGTGKTLCLLVGTFSWLRDNFHGTGKKSTAVPTVFYAARTHAQLSQVYKEYCNTLFYAPKNNATAGIGGGRGAKKARRQRRANVAPPAVYGSRPNFCIHPQVSTLPGDELNKACSGLCATRSCLYRNNVDTTDIEDIFTPDVNSVDTMMEECTKQKVCPYYFNRKIGERSVTVQKGKENTENTTTITTAENFHVGGVASSSSASAAPFTPSLVLLPYTYLMTPNQRATLNLSLKGSIIIIDEGHNIEQTASDCISVEWSTKIVGMAVEEVQRLYDYVEKAGKNEDAESAPTPPKSQNLLMLKSMLLSLETVMSHKPYQDQSFSGSFIFELLNQAKISFETHKVMLKFLDDIRQYVLQLREVGASVGLGSTNLDIISRNISATFPQPTLMECTATSVHYRVHITKDGVNYWCLSAHVGLANLVSVESVRSLVVTSGTLSPIEGYEMQLGIKFAEKLENDHVIDKDCQVRVRVAGTGIGGKTIKCTYDRRELPEQYSEVGNSIAAVCKNIPGGVIVFFTSYSNLEEFVRRWGGPDVGYQPSRGRNNFFKAQSTNPDGVYVHKQRACGSSSSTSWDRLLNVKNVVIEPRNNTTLQHCMDRYNGFVKNSPHGSLLLSVCRGRLSEGYDFSDGLCRGVVIVGLPFVNVSDTRVKLKRSYMDERCATLRKSGDTSGDSITGAQWYSQSAFRAINQAIGRLIRHKDDFGAVILMDARFESADNQAGISKWIRNEIKSDKFGKIVYDIGQFFKGVRNTSRLVAVAPPGNIKWSKGGCDWDELGHKVERSRLAVMQEETLRRQEAGDLADREFIEGGVVIAEDGEDYRPAAKRKQGIGMGGVIIEVDVRAPAPAVASSTALKDKQLNDKAVKSAKVKEFHVHITAKLAGKMDAVKANMMKVMTGDGSGVDGMISLLESCGKVDQTDLNMMMNFVQFVLPKSMQAQGLERMRPVQSAFARKEEEGAQARGAEKEEWEVAKTVAEVAVEKEKKKVNPFATTASFSKRAVVAKAPDSAVKSKNVALGNFISGLQSGAEGGEREEVALYVPANIKCPVCMGTPETPLVNSCGHLACKACWVAWVRKCKEAGRPGSCMTCREGVVKLKKIEWKKAK